MLFLINIRYWGVRLIRLLNLRTLLPRSVRTPESATRHPEESSGARGPDDPSPVRRIEWPTLCLAAAIYLSFGALTWFHAALPWWLLLALGGYIVAWQSSLQHEAVHGHPTPWPAANCLLVFPVLWLWLPFELYREGHLAHHRDELLTDPAHDSESWYLDDARWRSWGPFGRSLALATNTLLGRLLLGPPRCLYRLFEGQVPRLLAGEARVWRIWALHLAAVALVLGWAVGICGLPLWQYLLLFVYPAMALMQLRAFLEHQARPQVAHRTAIVEAAPPFALLYLNNNLHALHHAKPGLAWYRLPAVYRAERDSLLRGNGGYVYPGYGAIVRQYLWRAKEHPLHPSSAWPQTALSQTALSPSPSLPAQSSATPAAPALAAATARKP